MDPYRKIMRAAKRGSGLRLTPDDVFSLSRDTAIADAASQVHVIAERHWEAIWEGVEAKIDERLRRGSSAHPAVQSRDMSPQTQEGSQGGEE